MKERLRFAPSPTGHLHLGVARTAIFNWLLARKTKGEFILRIEDTDRERSTEEHVQAIIEGLTWLGLDWDGPVYHQTERMEIYQEHIKKLLKEGKAYKCFCPAEELEAKRKEAMAKGLKPKYDGRCRQADQNQKKPCCVRFLSPDEGVTTFKDELRGEITFENRELDDLIIRRTDETPTYNLTVVVDDVTMKITTVIRGDDHLNNTPRQVQLYQAFGYPVPRFVHTPLTLGKDKKRLSKRHGATSVLTYKEMGYLPEALFNFLVRLGWAHGDQEIFSREELIEKFSIEEMSKAPGIFNEEKLLWLNSHYIKECDDKELAELVIPFWKEGGIKAEVNDYTTAAVRSLKERGKTLNEIAELGKFYVAEPTTDPKAKEKFLKPDIKPILEEMAEKLGSLRKFNESGIKSVFEDMINSTGLGLGKIAQPVRVAITGGTVSPGIYETMEILGKEKVLKRLQKALLSF